MKNTIKNWMNNFNKQDTGFNNLSILNTPKESNYNYLAFLSTNKSKPELTLLDPIKQRKARIQLTPSKDTGCLDLKSYDPSTNSIITTAKKEGNHITANKLSLEDLTLEELYSTKIKHQATIICTSNSIFANLIDNPEDEFSSHLPRGGLRIYNDLEKSVEDHFLKITYPSRKQIWMNHTELHEKSKISQENGINSINSLGNYFVINTNEGNNYLLDPSKLSKGETIDLSKLFKLGNNTGRKSICPKNPAETYSLVFKASYNESTGSIYANRLEVHNLITQDIETSFDIIGNPYSAAFVNNKIIACTHTNHLPRRETSSTLKTRILSLYDKTGWCNAQFVLPESTSPYAISIPYYRNQKLFEMNEK